MSEVTKELTADQIIERDEARAGKRKNLTSWIENLQRVLSDNDVIDSLTVAAVATHDAFEDCEDCENGSTQLTGFFGGSEADLIQTLGQFTESQPEILPMIEIYKAEQKLKQARIGEAIKGSDNPLAGLLKRLAAGKDL